MGKVRLPSKREVFGEKRSDVFKKIGRECLVTDFATQLCLNNHKRWWLSTNAIHYGGVLFVNSSYFVDYDKLDYKESDRNIYSIKIRPTMDYDDFQEFKTNMLTNAYGVIEVEYGEYPQDEVSYELRMKLENAYNNNSQELKPTGKKYTITLGYTDDNKEKKPPVQLTEYEYDGKKYVRYINGFGKTNWVEVSPIVWYVDEVRKILISKKILLGQINRKDIPKFLNTYFADEILPIKSEKKETKTTDNNDETANTEMINNELSTIEKLINEIHKYLEGNPNKDKIIAKLVEMMNEYNSKLDNIGVMAEKNLPSLDTYDSVTAAFELKLNMLLVEVKKHHAAFKEYFDMIVILDKYVSLMNGNKDEKYTDGFISDLDVINTMCLPFLKEENANSIRKQLINIFNNEQKEIANYIDGKGEISYKTIDEMILDLRKKIHPVLGDLSTSVNKRDVEVEIRTSVSKIIDGLFDKPRNEALSFYLVEINNVYTNINALIDKLPSDMKKEYKKEILDIMNMEIDYSRDFNDIAGDLKTMWLSLNKVLYRMNGYLGRIEQIKSGHIDVNKIKK